MKIELAILGLLMEENLYGYEIKKKITEQIEDYFDVKFGSIYYAIKKSLNNGWIKKIGTEKKGENPERYIYQILPEGKKRYLRLLKQYFNKNLLHFNIDIVLLFYNSLTDSQKKQFIEDRDSFLKEKLVSLKNKTGTSSASKKNRAHIFSYIENHLKAEQAWLRSIKI